MVALAASCRSMEPIPGSAPRISSTVGIDTGLCLRVGGTGAWRVGSGRGRDSRKDITSNPLAVGRSPVRLPNGSPCDEDLNQRSWG